MALEDGKRSDNNEDRRPGHFYCDYLRSDELSAIATYKTPQVVKDYLEEQRLKKKREADELKKSSKRRRESKQTDEESSNGEA